MPCQAQANRYVGKGKDRMLYSGPCVLEEVGHDGEHLPASLAMVQAHNASFNGGVHTAVDAMLDSLRDRVKMSEQADELEDVFLGAAEQVKREVCL